jgi:chromosomal replication initiation ATPase DnaA
MRVKGSGEYPTIIIHKQDRIDYIVNGVCEYYDITRDALMKRYRSPQRHNRKRIAIKLLADVANCTLADIKETFGTTSTTAVYFSLQGIREDLSSAYNNLDLKKEYNDVVKYLRL